MVYTSYPYVHQFEYAHKAHVLSLLYACTYRTSSGILWYQYGVLYGHVALYCLGTYIVAFHLVCRQFYMLSGPIHPLFACNTQWKCIGGLTPATHP